MEGVIYIYGGRGEALGPRGRMGPNGALRLCTIGNTLHELYKAHIKSSLAVSG